MVSSRGFSDSRILRKQPLEMRSWFTGRLRQAGHNGSLPGRGLDTSSFLSYNMCSFVDITKTFFVWSQKRSTYSENRDDQSMRQVVAYRKLKTMESWKTVTLKSGCARLRQVIFLPGEVPTDFDWKKPLVFCLGGRTWRFNWSCIIAAKRFKSKKCVFVNCCRIHSRCFLPTLL